MRFCSAVAFPGAVCNIPLVYLITPQFIDLDCRGGNMANDPIVGAWELVSDSGVGITIYTDSHYAYRTGTQESSAVGWRPGHAR